MTEQPTRATYKGHGKPATFVYYGRMPQPRAEGVRARVDAGVILDAETGEQISSFGPATKMWIVPIPAEQSAGEPAAEAADEPAENVTAHGVETVEVDGCTVRLLVDDRVVAESDYLHPVQAEQAADRMRRTIADVAAAHRAADQTPTATSPRDLGAVVTAPGLEGLWVVLGVFTDTDEALITPAAEILEPGAPKHRYAVDSLALAQPTPFDLRELATIKAGPVQFCPECNRPDPLNLHLLGCDDETRDARPLVAGDQIDGEVGHGAVVTAPGLEGLWLVYGVFADTATLGRPSSSDRYRYAIDALTVIRPAGSFTPAGPRVVSTTLNDFEPADECDGADRPADRADDDQEPTLLELVMRYRDARVADADALLDRIRGILAAVPLGDVSPVTLEPARPACSGRLPGRTDDQCTHDALVILSTRGPIPTASLPPAVVGRMIAAGLAQAADPAGATLELTDAGERAAGAVRARMAAVTS